MSKQQKVLFIDQFNYIGGAQSILISLISVFNKNNYKVTVAFPEVSNSALHKTLEGSVDSFINLPRLILSNGRKTLKDVLVLLKYYKSIFAQIYSTTVSSDIVYVNAPRLFIIFFLISFFSRKKIFYHIHLKHSFLQKLIIGLIGIFSKSHFIVPSDFIENNVNKFLPRKNYSRIYNPLSDTYSKLPYKSLSLNNSYCMISRVSPEKGIEDFIKLAKIFPDRQFHHIGPCASEWEQYLLELKSGISENVFFHGPQSDLVGFLQEISATIAIVPSTADESFGLVVIECVAMSMPVIVREVGNLAYLADELGLYSFSSFDQLVSILENIDHDTSHKMTLISYNKVIDKYHFARFEKSIKDLLL